MAIAVVGVIGVALWSRALSPDLLKHHRLTTTVTAATEALEFDVPEGHEASWVLPPGTFWTIGGGDVPSGCTAKELEFKCAQDNNTRVIVESRARVALRATPAGGWTLTVSAIDDSEPIVAVFDSSGNEVLRSHLLLEFRTQHDQAPIRFPFVADTAVIGAGLYQAATVDDTPESLWQPALIKGDVRMIAENKPGNEKYEVLTDRLDAGDVIHVGTTAAEPPADTVGEVAEASLLTFLRPAPDDVRTHAIWGMFTANGKNAQEPDMAAFSLVLHTSLREVRVTRVGAPAGHAIRASTWTILQKWPNGQSTWIVFVSLILVSSFVLQLGQTLATRAVEDEGRDKALPDVTHARIWRSDDQAMQGIDGDSKIDKETRNVPH